MCSAAAPGGSHAGIKLKCTAEGGGATFFSVPQNPKPRTQSDRRGRRATLHRRGRRRHDTAAGGGGATSDRFRPPLQAVKIIDSKFPDFRGATRAQINKFRKFKRVGGRSRVVETGMADA